jgi:hypothetical protein
MRLYFKFKGDFCDFRKIFGNILAGSGSAFILRDSDPVPHPSKRLDLDLHTVNADLKHCLLWLSLLDNVIKDSNKQHVTLHHN